MNHPRLNSPVRRGVALILVLVLAAMLSVMTWAMITSASIRSQVNTNAADIVQAQYLAESGASLAAYYLQNPPANGLMTNPSTGDQYWTGITNTKLWSDAIAPVDVSIANPSAGRFVVTSIARLQVGGASISPGVRMTITRTTPLNQFSATTGSVSNVALPALNYPSSGGSTVAASAVPAPSNLMLVQQLSLATRAYTVNGVSGTAQRLPSSSVTSNWPVAIPLTNPLNIWWTDSATSIGNASLNGGTLVVLGSQRLTINGNPNFTALPKLPAIIATGDLHFQPNGGNSGNLNVNGVVYVGGTITGNGASSGTNANVSGALLYNGSSVPTSFRGRINLIYNAFNTSLPSFATNAFTTVAAPVVKVVQWESLSN